ncbi:Protein of unknown function [Gryllus bimaculatus]|nr:Protein of unknown function [Gryllus bimaculatus]
MASNCFPQHNRNPNKTNVPVQFESKSSQDLFSLPQLYEIQHKKKKERRTTIKEHLDNDTKSVQMMHVSA